MTGPGGHVIFDGQAYQYITDGAAAPDTVNPSLWRQSQMMRRGGLYKVAGGLYQARNNDIANLTIAEGHNGLVVIDCMAGVETAGQGMDLIGTGHNPGRRVGSETSQCAQLGR